jgi:hypothetical protein
LEHLESLTEAEIEALTRFRDNRTLGPKLQAAAPSFGPVSLPDDLPGRRILIDTPFHGPLGRSTDVLSLNGENRGEEQPISQSQSSRTGQDEVLLSLRPRPVDNITLVGVQQGPYNAINREQENSQNVMVQHKGAEETEESTEEMQALI